MTNHRLVGARLYAAFLLLQGACNPELSADVSDAGATRGDPVTMMDASPVVPNEESVFEEPGWWHHYHANSRNADRIADLPSVPRLEMAWEWRTGTAAFNGAALSRDQETIYVTASEDAGPNFFALNALTGNVRWTFDALNEWATFSSALVDSEDTIYVADNEFIFAIEPPREPGGQPREKWRFPHDHVSMSLGFTADGDLFEVTHAGTVNLISRDGVLLATVRLPGSRYLPPGVGLLADLVTNEALLEGAAEDPRSQCEEMAAPDGTTFFVPEHVVHFWRLIRGQRLLASSPMLVETFFDTAFGGTFVSNTPGGVEVEDGVFRIFIPTIGEYVPPTMPATDVDSYPCPNSSTGRSGVYPMFGAASPGSEDPNAHLRRGYYRGYLHAIDWRRGDRSLTVTSVELNGPSGTSPAISAPATDGEPLVFVAGTTQLYAWRAKSLDLKWTWDAGLEVGGSPTVFTARDFGDDSDEPAVMVLAGFAGVQTIVDSPDGSGSESCDGRCRPLWQANSSSLRDLDRVLSVATSVAEAGRDHTYVQFTEGPPAEERSIGDWNGYLPLRSRLAVIENRTGTIVQTLPMPEAQVCDSTLSTTGWVYAIHTSGLDQIKHALYPRLFSEPLGGIIAYRPSKTEENEE